MHVSPLLIAILAQYKYFAMVPLALVIQPAVAIVAGMFIRAGYLDLIPAYGTVVAVALVGDVMWYYIGYHYGERFARRFGKYFGISDDHVDTVKTLFNRYDSTILLFSKVTNGLGLANVTLFTAGLSRISFSRYMAFNAIGEFVWSAMMIAVGFYFTQIYNQVDGVLGKSSTVALFVVGVIAIIAFSHRLYRRISASVQARSEARASADEAH